MRLIPPIAVANDRAFGTAVSEAKFKDADGIDVIATLYLDQEDQPFELNVWKTDFSPLLKIPENIFAQAAE